MVVSFEDGLPKDRHGSGETHFTIYTIELNATYNKPVWTRDQFKAQQFGVGKAQFLGVPSRKYLVNP